MKQQTKFILLLLCGLAGIAAFALLTSPPNTSSQKDGTHTDVQAHSPNIQSFGDQHIEAQMDKAGAVQLFFYSKKPGQLMSVPIEEIKRTLQAETLFPGEDPAIIDLRADPLPGEPEGMTSHFVGKFDRRDDQQVVGLILTFTLSGNAYRVRWQPGHLAPGQFAASDHEQPSMPAALASDAERKLFLTPGGAYTEADIQANGGVPPSQKYKGFRAAHNMNPKQGDRLCPITDTQANTKLTWIIGGKSYPFCCPPCIEEFVVQAKTKPTTIYPPEHYVKR